MAARVGQMTTGDGFAPGVEQEPLIDGAAVGKVAARVEDGLAKGGGRRPPCAGRHLILAHRDRRGGCGDGAGV